jgi:exopolyphosphatase/guanosine-5'-triphosphate,3'-diphosphate pyrophosphatase
MNSVLAAIDIGTNSVLLTVASAESGGLLALAERAEITRLGKGVDKTGTLSEPGMSATLRVLGAYVEEALGFGVTDPRVIACVATSAARDAENGPAFLNLVREETGLTLEIIGGKREAELTLLAARHDFGPSQQPLAVVDLGGGSTEVAIDVDRAAGPFAESFPIGSVRLHERWGEDRAAVLADIDRALQAVPKVRAGARVVGIAGTWTTLATLALELTSYDAARVHGHVLSVETVEALADRLWGLTLTERLLLPGLQPGRADVIAVGALIAARALRALGATEVVVSDRGVRWGLLYERLRSRPV